MSLTDDEKAADAERILDGKKVTLSGKPPETLDAHAPGPVQSDGMHKDYWVLSPAEIAKGLVRPLRRTYLHLPCGCVTRMGESLALTYARDPSFYGATYCVKCQAHYPVGKDGEFVWDDGSGQKVGT